MEAPSWARCTWLDRSDFCEGSRVGCWECGLSIGTQDAMKQNGLPHAAAKATKAAASKPTKAATAASRCIAGMPTHGYDAMREAAMAVALEVLHLLCAIGD